MRQTGDLSGSLQKIFSASRGGTPFGPVHSFSALRSSYPNPTSCFIPTTHTPSCKPLAHAIVQTSSARTTQTASSHPHFSIHCAVEACLAMQVSKKHLSIECNLRPASKCRFQNERSRMTPDCSSTYNAGFLQMITRTARSTQVAKAEAYQAECARGWWERLQSLPWPAAARHVAQSLAALGWSLPDSPTVSLPSQNLQRKVLTC